MGARAPREAVDSDLESIWFALERYSAPAIIVAIAVMSGIVAAIFSTDSASGADASGYLSEAAHVGVGPGSLYRGRAGEHATADAIRG